MASRGTAQGYFGISAEKWMDRGVSGDSPPGILVPCYEFL